MVYALVKYVIIKLILQLKKKYIVIKPEVILEALLVFCYNTENTPVLRLSKCYDEVLLLTGKKSLLKIRGKVKLIQNTWICILEKFQFEQASSWIL